MDSLEFDPASIFDSQFRFKEIIQGFLSVLVLAFLARGFRKSANFPGILRLSKNIQDGLRALGHKVMVASDSDFAVVQAVYRKTGEGIYAKSDPRKYGAPAGG